MMHSYSKTISQHDAGKRLDVYLADNLCYESRSAAVRAIDSSHVYINGRCAKKNSRLCAGDTVVYEVEQEFYQAAVGQNIALDIRFEDEDLIVLSKPAGLVCHPCSDHRDGTLVNALIYHCGSENLCNVQGDGDRLGIVHRLDRDTSGLMLAAKSNEVGRALMEAISQRRVERHYICLVHGILGVNSGLIDAPIARDVHDRTHMAISDSLNARDALTTFKVLERFDALKNDNGYSLLDCKLATGRTHQIRVHMQYIRHPIVGDLVYTSHSPRSEIASLGISRQFLHSYNLSFDHPLTGEHLAFYDGLPPELISPYEAIHTRSCGRTDIGEKLQDTILCVNV